MKNDEEKTKGLVLTKGIKIASIYLIVAGGLGILWHLTELGPHYPEFQAKSFAYKFGAYTRDSLINIIFVISGLYILYKKAWARKMSLVILVISTIYSANNFAWGFAKGPPSTTIRLISFLVLVLWNGIWFYLIFRAKPLEIILKRG